MSASSQLPAAGRLAWWGTAWLRGHVVADLMIDAVIGSDATHVVAGLAGLGLGGEEGTAETLVAGLARLRAEGATAFGAAFPAEGDPVGLGGPADFNAEGLEAGQAVVALDAAVGLVPFRVGAAVTWHAHRAERRQVPDVGEADRALREVLPKVADHLARLDVARWRPELAARLISLRRRPPLTAPDGMPARCVELAARALQALEIVDLAVGGDDGPAAYDAQVTWEALRPLSAAARRALVAACSPEAWPPA